MVCSIPSRRPSRRWKIRSKRLKIFSSCVTTRIAPPRSVATRLNKSITTPARCEFERRGWFIGQDDARPIRQSAGDRHPLRFAAGELGGHRQLAVPDIEIIQQRLRFRPGAARLYATQLHNLGHIFDAVQERQKIVRLENETDLFEPQTPEVTAQPALIVDDLSIQLQPSAGRFGDAADEVEERALA